VRIFGAFQEEAQKDLFDFSAYSAVEVFGLPETTTTTASLTSGSFQGIE
jgi:hypothetical protein